MYKKTRNYRKKSLPKTSESFNLQRPKTSIVRRNLTFSKSKAGSQVSSPRLVHSYQGPTISENLADSNVFLEVLTSPNRNFNRLSINTEPHQIIRNQRMTSDPVKVERNTSLRVLATAAMTSSLNLGLDSIRSRRGSTVERDKFEMQHDIDTRLRNHRDSITHHHHHSSISRASSFRNESNTYRRKKSTAHIPSIMNSGSSREDNKKKAAMQSREFYELRKDNFRQLRKINSREVDKMIGSSLSRRESISSRKMSGGIRLNSRIIYEDGGNRKPSMTSSNVPTFSLPLVSQEPEIYPINLNLPLKAQVMKLTNYINMQNNKIDDSRIIECLANEIVVSKWCHKSESSISTYLDRFRQIQDLNKKDRRNLKRRDTHSDVSSNLHSNLMSNYQSDQHHDSYENLHSHSDINLNPIEIMICIEFIDGNEIYYQSEAMSKEHKLKAAKILEKWRKNFHNSKSSLEGLIDVDENGRTTSEEIALKMIEKWKNIVKSRQPSISDKDARRSSFCVGKSLEITNLANANCLSTNSTPQKSFRNISRAVSNASSINVLNKTVRNDILNGKKPYENTKITEKFQGKLNYNNSRVLLPYDANLKLLNSDKRTNLYEINQLSNSSSWEYFEQLLPDSTKLTFYLMSNCNTETTHVKTFISLIWRVLRFSVNEWMKENFSFNPNSWHGILDSVNEDIINYWRRVLEEICRFFE